MVYALPRKTRTSDAGDASTSHVVSPPKSSVERALELQHVLDASHRAPRASDTPHRAGPAHGTPRRRMPHAFADDAAAPPTSSTPLTPRRALRPYPDFPAPNWSAPRSSPRGTPSQLRRTTRPMAVLDEDDEPADAAPAPTAPPARVHARGAFMPQRRPAPAPAVDEAHLVQRPPSPASSTDDPLLLNDSGMLNMTMQAAQGDADLVAMVRGWEHAGPSSPATPRRMLRPVERTRPRTATPTASTPLRRDLRTIERSVQRAAQAQAQLQSDRTASPSTPTRTPRAAPGTTPSGAARATPKGTAQATPRATPSVAERSHATPSAAERSTRATPSLYDRSLGVRERIALLKSPRKARDAPEASEAPEAPEAPELSEPLARPPDSPDRDPTYADDLPELPLAPIPSHTPARESQRAASATPRRASSRRRPSSAATPVYIDFLHAPPDEAPDDELPFTRETPDAQRTRVVSPVKIRSASRTASPVRPSPVPIASTPRSAAKRREPSPEPEDAFAFERVSGAVEQTDAPASAAEPFEPPAEPEEGEPDEEGPYEEGPDEGEPYEGEPYEEGPYEEGPDEGEPYEGEPYEGGPYEERQDLYELDEPEERYEAEELEELEELEEPEEPEEPEEAEIPEELEEPEVREDAEELAEAEELEEPKEPEEPEELPYPREAYDPETYDPEPQGTYDASDPAGYESDEAPQAPHPTYVDELEADDGDGYDGYDGYNGYETDEAEADDADADEPAEAMDVDADGRASSADGHASSEEDAEFALEDEALEALEAQLETLEQTAPVPQAQAQALLSSTRPLTHASPSREMWDASAQAETASLAAELMAHRTTDAGWTWGDVTSLDTIDVDAEARAFAAQHALWSPRSPRRARRSLLGRSPAARAERMEARTWAEAAEVEAAEAEASKVEEAPEAPATEAKATEPAAEVSAPAAADASTSGVAVSPVQVVHAKASPSKVVPIRTSPRKTVPVASPARRASPWKAAQTSATTPRSGRKPPISLPAVVPWRPDAKPSGAQTTPSRAGALPGTPSTVARWQGTPSIGLPNKGSPSRAPPSEAAPSRATPSKGSPSRTAPSGVQTTSSGAQTTPSKASPSRAMPSRAPLRAAAPPQASLDHGVRGPSPKVPPPRAAWPVAPPPTEPPHKAPPTPGAPKLADPPVAAFAAPPSAAGTATPSRRIAALPRHPPPAEAVATPPEGHEPMALPQDFRPHKPSPQKHATLPTVRTSPARRPASRVPVPVRRARAAYVEDADETHDVPASGAGAGASFSGDAPAGDLASALVVGDAPADDSTLILEGRGEASADAPAMVAGHKHGRTPSPASPSSSSSSSPSPKRQRRDEQVWSLPLQAARPRTPAARTPSPHTSVSEATPAPILSSPAEPWPLLPHAEAVADLSANLSASSHSRALMLARPRPTACIEVASLDPVAAARAAAILQVHHHYIQEGWLVQEPPAGARRHGAGAAYPALPDVSGSVSLPALLKAAEDGERSWSAAVPGAFPPGSARRRRSLRAPVVTAHALRPQAQAGKWSDDAWAQLERHLAAEVARHVEAGASDDAAAQRRAVPAVDAGAVVRAFLDAEGLEADDLQGEWARTRLHARVPALQARYLRRLDATEAAAPDVSTALREQSFHALAEADATATDALVHGPRARGARSVRGASPDLSVPTMPMLDAEVTQSPGSTSMVARLWSRVWGRGAPATEEGEGDAAGDAAGEAAGDAGETSEVRAPRAPRPPRAPQPPPPPPSPPRAAGGWAGRCGSSGVQSTAFTALGAQAQEEAAIAARRRAAQRVGAWQSPRQQRLHPSTRRDRRPGDPPRAAYVAARDRFAQGAAGSLPQARRQGAGDA